MTGRKILMFRDVSVEEAMQMDNSIFVDVRSEGEFKEATIPGAINIPLLDDNERALVGTLYKEEGPKSAKIKALEIIGPKLPQIIVQYNDLKSRYKNPILFCWRGGMRSYSIATILDLMDLSLYRITGGYKAYRKIVNDFFAQPVLKQKIVVLRGLTGVGKTDIIYNMERSGIPVIDLEGLAHNRGSVFGAVGMKPPPSQKMFDALLMEKLIEYENNKYIIVECESKKVGRVYLPDVLMRGMQDGLQILVYDDINSRTDCIIRQYTTEQGDNKEQLKRAIGCLENSLGKKRVSAFNDLVDNGEYREVVRYLLEEYYDPLYNYPDHPTEDYHFSVKSDNIDEAVHKIKNYLECYFS